MDNCSMPECPMGAQQESRGCHDAAGSSHDLDLVDCDSFPGAWVGCCVSPVEPQSAKAFQAVREQESISPVSLVEIVELRPAPPLAERIARTVASQEHDLGRFLLLSSLLL